MMTPHRITLYLLIEEMNECEIGDIHQIKKIARGAA